MANPFINSSFTLRPSTNDRDRPELTLRHTEVSQIPRETAVTTRTLKRQRLFMDRSSSTREHSFYANEDQFISEDEYDTPIIQRRRVSCEVPSRHRICPGSAVGDNNYWKARCHGMQSFCDDSKNRLMEAEEDQRQLRLRIRELEEQLLLQTSRSNSTSVVSMDGDGNNNETLAEGKNNGEDAAEKVDEDMDCTESKKRAPPALVIEIKDNHQAVSSCFYMTDGEGLNESYDLDMEDDEDTSMNVAFTERILNDIDDDRNDNNMNVRH